MRRNVVLLFLVWAGTLDLAAAETLSNEYIVKTADRAALEAFASEHSVALGPLITYPNPSQKTIELFGDFYLVKMPLCEKAALESLARELEGLSGVEYVEPNAMLELIPGEIEPPGSLLSMPDTSEPYIPNDPRYDEQWDKPITGTDFAWNISKGEDVIIAILDTGVDTTHEDLVDNLVDGYNFALNNEDIWDIAGHGTAVSGVACARMDNAKGVAGTAGKTSLMMCRIMDNSGNMYVSSAVNAINYALDHGVKIISMSWGDYRDLGMIWTINSAWNRGAFMCAGVANDNQDKKFYPAAYEKVMAVGATNEADTRWPSSNYGAWVDIFAPGGVSTSRGGGYGGVQATSFTTPQIAGLAALIWSAYPHATNQQIWDQIINCADTIDSDVGPILRMNSKKAVYTEIPGIEEHNQASSLVSAEQIQKGKIRFLANTSTEYTLSLYDVTGRQVYSTEGRTKNGEITVHPDLVLGVYFWMIKTDSAQSSGKLVYLR